MHARIEASHLDPDELPANNVSHRSDAHLVEPVLEAIQAAIADCSVTAAQTFAGTIYKRKGYNLTTAFGETPNQSYSSENDDVYLEIGIRVPRNAARPVREAIARVESSIDSQKLRETQARLERAREQTAAAQAHEDSIKAEIERLAGSTSQKEN